MLRIVLLALIIVNTAFAEMAPTTLTEAKPTAMISVTQPTFIIKLKSNPTTGYSWFLRGYDANLLVPIKHSFQAEKDTHLIGASGYELWTFRVKPAGFVVPQQTLMRFNYMRPWEATAASTVIFNVITK